MKVKYLAGAVAALGSLSASAVVLDPATAVVPASNYYYIAGASAQSQAYNAIIKGLFDVPADVVQITAANSGTCAGADNSDIQKHVAYLGVRNSVNTMIVYRNNGGSGSGTLQLLAKTTAAPQIVTSGKVIALPASVAGGSSGAWTATPTNCAVKLPVVVLLDVRPTEHTAAVVGLFNSANYDPVSDIKPVVKTGLQGFGVAVSAALYSKLVAANTAAGIPLINGQPTISKSDYASLSNFSGTIKSAADLLKDPAETGTLELARRVATSGTQASSEIYFLKAKTSGEQTPVTAADFPLVDIATNGFAVTEGASTGNVKTRLNSAGMVIGIMSLENVPAGADTWKWVRVDGVSADQAYDLTTSTVTSDPKQRQQMAAGNWDFAYESYVAYKDNALNATGTDTTAGLARAIYTNMSKTSESDLPGYAYLDLPGTWAAWKSGDGYTGNKNKQSRVSRSGNNLNPLQY